MIDSEFQTIGLYEHNADSYRTIKSAYESGEDIVSIVHATGTGKSYNALQLAYDNKDKKIVYIVPSSGIIEHIKKIIDDNPNLDLKRDFPNLEFKTYQSLVNLSEEEIEQLNIDLMILDEFHHIGAPIWGNRINKIIETHPQTKVFGMTAYTVRDRGTAYERDMANPEGTELFSNKIVSRYDICDAMIDGVLPKPVYKSAHINLIEMEEKLEQKVQKLNPESKYYKELMEILSNVKKRIHEAPSIPNILRRSIKPNGKYIYFCPPNQINGTNDIETIKKQAIEWFKKFVPEEDIIVYTTTSDMGIEGKKNRDAFYDDLTLEGEKADKKLRVMFAINQYNEGVHAPDIDGVIMGRGTGSDIVYFEQLGRALSVRGNTKEEFEELEKKSLEELIEICKSKDIPIKENPTKEDLIEKIIAPIIIDLTDNYTFIKELENRLKDRIKEAQTANQSTSHKRKIKLTDATFDIEVENQDIFETLQTVLNRLTKSWEDSYELAKAYYEHYGNLEVPYHFRTIDGYTYDENGYRLGQWIGSQRKAYKGKSYRITEEQIELLKNIGMRFENLDRMQEWLSKYELAKAYYERYGNLIVSRQFKTLDGYTYDEKGFALGSWIDRQRQVYKGQLSGIITKEQVELLKKIGMRFENIDRIQGWLSKYELAKAYYEHYGNLEVPFTFKTLDGYTFDENGTRLGEWIGNQRKAYKGKGKSTLSEEQTRMLENIGMRFENLDKMQEWLSKYSLAKKYYEHYGNLEIPLRFKTIDGHTYDEKGFALGDWISSYRRAYKGKGTTTINEEKIRLLKKIGMRFENLDKNGDWLAMYNLAKKYYEIHGNLEIPSKFKTLDGYTHDEKGEALGNWIARQRQIYKGNKSSVLTEEQIKLLENIEINWYSENNDKKLQSEEITPKNQKRKTIEVLNRLKTFLNKRNSTGPINKEEINQAFLDELNNKSSKK